MYWVFAWNDGKSQGGMGDWLAQARTWDQAVAAARHAKGSYDHVQLIEITGASWIARYDWIER